MLLDEQSHSYHQDDPLPCLCMLNMPTANNSVKFMGSLIHRREAEKLAQPMHWQECGHVGVAVLVRKLEKKMRDQIHFVRSGVSFSSHTWGWRWPDTKQCSVSLWKSYCFSIFIKIMLILVYTMCYVNTCVTVDYKKIMLILVHTLCVNCWV